jgi:lysyl-tRNA synthetase class 2
MAQLVLHVAGLLFLVESQASDVADHLSHHGFLSKYIPSGSDSSKRSMSGYDKFTTPNLDRVKQGNGADPLSSHSSPAEPSPNMGADPFTIVDDKPALHPTAQVQDAIAFKAARGEPSIIMKDLNPPTIADREEKQGVQKLLTDASINSTALSAIGIGLLSLVTMLGVRLRRSLQPLTVPVSSGGLGHDMPMNTASALGDNVMEMNSPARKVNSSTVGWGQLPSQNALCSLPVAASAYTIPATRTAAPRWRRTIRHAVDLSPFEEEVVRSADQQYPLTLDNVEMILDELRPYLMSDGGNVRVSEIEGPVVRLQLEGACGDCPSSTMTMKMGLERRLMEAIPEIAEVVQVLPDVPDITEEAIDEVLDSVRPFLSVAGGAIDLVSLSGVGGIQPTIMLKLEGKSASLFSVKNEISQRIHRHFMTSGLRVEYDGDDN